MPLNLFANGKAKNQIKTPQLNLATFFVQFAQNSIKLFCLGNFTRRFYKVILSNLLKNQKLEKHYDYSNFV